MAAGENAARGMLVRDRLVFFTTDKGYLVPTLVAADQVQQQLGVEGPADVLVALIECEDSTLTALRDEFPRILFQIVSPECFALPDSAYFNQTHVSKSTLARLRMGDQLDASYKHLIYLDGDIQLTGDVHPLILFDVPEGKILAAPDVAEVVWPEIGKFASGFRSYVRRLGLDSPNQYFNAGVLAATAATWRHIGFEAFRAISKHSEICRYHDQSALNMVSVGRRVPMSPMFNYSSILQRICPERSGSAAILHFTGGEKPWTRGAAPNIARFAPIYADFVERHPVLLPFWEATAGRGAEGSVHQPPKWSLSTLPQTLRMMSRRRRVRRMLERTTYAF